GGLIAAAAALVLAPGTPLGLLTNAVQALAGVLLPSATVFLLLLCNDKPVLGPWVNNRWLNTFTGAVIAALVVLSVILTVSVLFPNATNAQTILGILTGGGVAAVIIALVIMALSQNGKAGRPAAEAVYATALSRSAWRMPPLGSLPPAKLSLAAKTWMGILRLYLAVAGGLVLVRIVSLAIRGG
ncbi:MAG: manganese transporter, partial [Hyphomicrobiales bacterium]|nr:manganese transporter [Hyphomicrobiales bacterium]